MIIRAILILSMFFFAGCQGSGRFSVHSSLLGEFASANVNSSEGHGRYAITIKVHSTGIYNLVRGKRIEQYRSQGNVRHGKYYSHLFAIEKWANGKHSLAEYTFDYRRHKILRHYRDWIEGKAHENVTDSMDYFGHDDFLTVMHNAIRGESKTPGRRKTVIVAGADNTHGNVPVYVSNDPKRVVRWGGSPDGAVVQVGIAKGIFDGGEGSFTAVLDAQNRPIKLVIKKVKIVRTVTVTPEAPQK